jgi:hypothetical protein
LRWANYENIPVVYLFFFTGILYLFWKIDIQIILWKKGHFSPLANMVNHFVRGLISGTWKKGHFSPFANMVNGLISGQCKWKTYVRKYQPLNESHLRWKISFRSCVEDNYLFLEGHWSKKGNITTKWTLTNMGMKGFTSYNIIKE